ncbi:MAG: peptidoglycan-binding domain-containing protein [Desulfobacteraceae bacterium]
MRCLYKWPGFVLLLSIILCAGCVGVAQNTKGSLTTEDTVLVTPKRTPLDLPGHSELAIAALLHKIRHETNTAAEFDVRGSHDVQESFSYAGFDVDNVDIAKNILVKENPEAALINLGGFLHFQDETARRNTVGFEMHYKVFKKSDKPPVIVHSYTANITPAFPLVSAFFIPAEIFSRSENMPDSFADYLRFAREHAIDMGTEDSMAPGKRHKKQSLIVLIFCFDRLPDESFLDVTVDNYKVNPVVMDFDGWQILALGGKGRLFNPSESFFIDVHYYKKRLAIFNRQHIARFSSLKQNPENNWTRALQQISRKTEGKLHAQTSKGSIEKGKRLLDVKKHDDAVIVQTRLQELGYYQMKVDGIFGKGSKAALKNWSRDHLNREAEILTLEIQKALFKGTGQ